MISYVKQLADEGWVKKLDSIHKDTQTLSKVEENEIEATSEAARHTYFFLNKLQATANQNAKREKGGYRYDPETKLFASYFRMIAGPLTYNTLQKNLENFESDNWIYVTNESYKWNANPF